MPNFYGDDRYKAWDKDRFIADWTHTTPAVPPDDLLSAEMEILSAAIRAQAEAYERWLASDSLPLFTDPAAATPDADSVTMPSQPPTLTPPTSAALVIRFTAERGRAWPPRPETISPPRRFHIEVEIAIEPNAGMVPAADLLTFCKQVFGGGRFGDAPRETLAHRLGLNVARRYGRHRGITVAVFEDDGEIGIKVHFAPGASGDHERGAGR